MERYVAKSPQLQICKREIDLGPYDLAFAGPNLIVAVGNEGVLVRTGDGQWSRVEVVGAKPAPFAGGPDLAVLLWILPRENALSTLAGVLVWLVLCVLGWSIVHARVVWPAGRSVRWALAPLVWVVALLIVGLLLAYWLVHIQIFLLLLPLAVAVPMLLGAALVWYRLASISSLPWKVCLAAGTAFVAAVAVRVLAWLPFALWVYGVIAVYETALTISVLAGSLSVGAGIWLVWQTSRLACP